MLGSNTKEGNVLFNDAFNIFYLRLYGVGHMVKDHSDSERGNPLPPHGLLFFDLQQGFFCMHHPTDIAHTTAFVTSVVELWLEREIAQWVHPMKDRSDDPSHHEWTLLPRSYISLPRFTGVLTYYWCYLTNLQRGYIFVILLVSTCCRLCYFPCLCSLMVQTRCPGLS